MKFPVTLFGSRHLDLLKLSNLSNIVDGTMDFRPNCRRGVRKESERRGVQNQSLGGGLIYGRF